MDPKSTTLDPKLKEVYDRVMGTSAGVPQPNTSPPPQPIAPSTSSQIPSGPSHPQSAPVVIPPPTNDAQSPTQPPSSTHQSSMGQTSPSAFPPPKSSLDASAPAKSAVDYAALAAKYATPPPPLNESQSAATGTLYTPPATGGGLIPPAPTTPTHADSAQQATNAATHANTAGKSGSGVATFNATVQVPTNSSVPVAKNSSALLKIALIVGVPVFLVAYSIVWMVVFKVDIMKFLPGA